MTLGHVSLEGAQQGKGYSGEMEPAHVMFTHCTRAYKQQEPGLGSPDWNSQPNSVSPVGFRKNHLEVLVRNAASSSPSWDH